MIGHKVIPREFLSVPNDLPYFRLVVDGPADLIDQITEVTLKWHVVFVWDEFVIEMLVERRILLQDQ